MKKVEVDTPLRYWTHWRRHPPGQTYPNFHWCLGMVRMILVPATVEHQAIADARENAPTNVL